MTPTMPADRKQVEEAVERCREGVECEHWPAFSDLRLLLTDHAALLARAEAAEAALIPREPTDAMLKAAFAAMNATPSGEWKRMKAAGQTARHMFDAKMRPRWTAMWDAACSRLIDDKTRDPDTLVRVAKAIYAAESSPRTSIDVAKAAITAVFATHQQPAPVKAGETSNAD